MHFNYAQRLELFPTYLFKEIDLLYSNNIKNRKLDIINLGVGDPDQPTPKQIIETLNKATLDPINHKYPVYSGMKDFHEAIAEWYIHRFSVKLNSTNEIITLIGSKEGLAHFPLAFVNPGDIVLYPSPGYPVYYSSTIIAGGTPIAMPLYKKNNFFPDIEAISKETLSRTKILIINYPNNPTTATSNLNFYQKLVDFAHKYKIIVVSDAAYTEIAYDNYQPHSFLEVPGAKEIGIEFHSLSKSYNMAGWRLGFAVGNKKLIAGLEQIKNHIDSGVFNAIQLAGITALTNNQNWIKKICIIYQERRDILVAGLKKIGLNVELPKATFYVWCECPPQVNSIHFTKYLLNKCGIITTPGRGFGEAGEGYIRFSLTVNKERLEEASRRLSVCNIEENKLS